MVSHDFPTVSADGLGNRERFGVLVKSLALGKWALRSARSCIFSVWTLENSSRRVVILWSSDRRDSTSLTIRFNWCKNSGWSTEAPRLASGWYRWAKTCEYISKTGGRSSGYSASKSSPFPGGAVDSAHSGVLYPVIGDPWILGVSLTSGSVLWNEFPGVASGETVDAKDGGGNGGARFHVFCLQDGQWKNSETRFADKHCRW